MIMKDLIKKFSLFVSLVAVFFTSAFAIESEPQNCFFEIVLKIDGATQKSGYFLKKEAVNPNAIPALQEILKSEPDFAKVLANKADIKRAKAFHSRMGLDNLEIVACVKDGQDVVAFFKSKTSKLRPDMNFFAFKNVNGEFLWDLSARSPLLAVLSESVRNDAAGHCADESKILKFIDISNSQNADLPVFAFYKKAQKDFYDLKLEAYGDIMTPKSLEVFTNQYLKLSKEARYEALKDYITYHKSFWKIADLGKLNVILFTRHRDGKINSYDAAFILKEKDGFRLSNFGQDQGTFATYLIESLKSKN